MNSNLFLRRIGKGAVDGSREPLLSQDVFQPQHLDDTSEEEPVIAGPYTMYDGSFVIEYLKPKPSRNASALMRSTYKASHPLCKKGKTHPQAPPLHMHFKQTESLAVISGSVGTTTLYSNTDTIHTPQNASESNPFHIPPYTPHRFWPDPNATEDTVMLIWAHPTGDTDDVMDRLFFHNVLSFVDDVYQQKASLDVSQLLLMQHAAASTLVMFPTAWFLGPLRWWVPWTLQCIIATVARWQGKRPLMRKYLTAEEWESVKMRN